MVRNVQVILSERRGRAAVAPVARAGLALALPLMSARRNRSQAGRVCGARSALCSSAVRSEARAAALQLFDILSARGYEVFLDTTV